MNFNQRPRPYAMDDLYKGVADAVFEVNGKYWTIKFNNSGPVVKQVEIAKKIFVMKQCDFLLYPQGNLDIYILKNGIITRL